MDTLLQNERAALLTHEIQYNHNLRLENLRKVMRMNPQKIRIAKYPRTFNMLSYEHFMVQIKSIDENKEVRHGYIEFGGGELTNAEVQFVELEAPAGLCNSAIDFTPDHQLRIDQVMGMKNYSVLYRNCEHIANYIYSGIWVSNQIIKSKLCDYIIPKLGVSVIKELGMPKDLLPPVGNRIRCVERVHPIKFDSRHLYLTQLPKEHHNILLFGSSGVGKSNLINHLVGLEVCKSEKSPVGVTKEVVFVQGTHKILKTTCNLVDTIGLNEKGIDWELLFFLITSKIKSKHIFIHQIWLLINLEEKFLGELPERVKKLYVWLTKNKELKNYRLIFTHNRIENKAKSRKDLTDKFVDELKSIEMPPDQYCFVDLFDKDTVYTGRRNLNRDVISGKIIDWIINKPNAMTDLSMIRRHLTLFSVI